MQYYSPSTPSQGNPVDMVKSLRAQGMDNNQVIQTLQRQGFSSNTIFEAMNQLDTGAGDSQPQEQYQNYPVFPQGSSNSEVKPQRVSSLRENTTDEELIEAIIEEKWSNLVKDLDKIIEWKNSANNKIISMEQKMEDMRHEFDKLHSAIISKIDDYDKNISTVGAEVKAMEKVFSKVLPVFSENVSELSRIAKDLKRPPVAVKSLK
jgi:DNA-binding transcriptional MerR regulator